MTVPRTGAPAKLLTRLRIAAPTARLKPARFVAVVVNSRLVGKALSTSPTRTAEAHVKHAIRMCSLACALVVIAAPKDAVAQSGTILAEVTRGLVEPEGVDPPARQLHAGEQVQL